MILSWIRAILSSSQKSFENSRNTLESVRRVEQSLREINSIITKLQRDVRRISWCCCHVPGSVRLLLGEELFMSSISQFPVKLILPPPGAPDVTKRRITVSTGAGDPLFFEVQPEEAEIQLPNVYNQGSELSVELVDVDDAGNQSSPSLSTFIIQDTQAPPTPGQVNFVLGEESFTS